MPTNPVNVPEAGVAIPVSQLIHLIPTPKEGWKTTEFWLTVASQGIAALVLLKVIPAKDAAGLQTGIAQFVPAAFAAAASGAGLVAYIISRLRVKTAVTPAVVPIPLVPPANYTPPPTPAVQPTPVVPPAPSPYVLPPERPVVPPSVAPAPWTQDHTSEVLR